MLYNIFRTREKHGMSKTPEYRAWQDIRDRVFNAANKRYSDYGGRGIGMYDPWAYSFVDFYAHVGDRPSAKHSIDRIDNERGYEPGNVKWSTKREQVLNRRMQKNNTTGYVGVYKVQQRYRADISYHGQVIYVGLYKTAEAANKARLEALQGLK